MHFRNESQRQAEHKHELAFLFEWFENKLVTYAGQRLEDERHPVGNSAASAVPNNKANRKLEQNR